MAKRKAGAGGKSLIPAERIERTILLIRGEKVMLSNDLALLYRVEPKVLIQSVKRNIARFPRDFMFQLSKQEFDNLKSQIVTSRWGGARRATPYAFTEQGVAMLSSVLRSPRAVAVNIEIMRAFVRLRQLISTHDDLRRKIEELEQKYDEQFAVVFDAIRRLMDDSGDDAAEAKRRIGYETESGKQARGTKNRAAIKARTAAS